MLLFFLNARENNEMRIIFGELLFSILENSRREIEDMAKIIDWFPKIIFCKIPEIIIEMIPNAGIIKM